MSDLEDLTPGQQAAINALLASPTIRAAASKAEVSDRQIYRWMREPAFKAVYRQAQADLHEQTIAAIHAMGTEAAEALLGIMRNPEAPAPSRVTAARAILDIISRHQESCLAERLDSLQATVESWAPVLREYQARGVQ